VAFCNLCARLVHFRTRDNKEADFLLERADDRLAGVDVKSSDTVKSEDFKGTRVSLEVAGNDFVSSGFLYTGEDAIPFGEKLPAFRVWALWN